MSDIKTENMWLMKGDCLERMKEINDESIDLVVIDPPYGIDFQSQRKKDKQKWMPKIANDKTPFTAWLCEAHKKMKNNSCGIVFCRWDVWGEFQAQAEIAGFKVKDQLIWDKMNHGTGDLRGAPGCRHEIAMMITKGRFIFKGKRPQSVMQIKKVSPSKLLHPNEKPVQLMEYIVNHYSAHSDVVADFTMGVSPVGIACKNLNRKFIGIEMDDKYFEIAKNRIMNND